MAQSKRVLGDLLLGVIVLGLATYSVPSQACSLPACQPGDTFPTTGNVPANVLAWFVLESTRSENGVIGGFEAGVPVDGVRVFIVAPDGGVEEELELTQGEEPSPAWPDGADQVWLSTSEVEVGTRLRVESSSSCVATRTSELVVTEPQAIPTTLGTLDVTTGTGELYLWTNSGACVDPVWATYADVEVQLSSEALPFADVLRYSLLVDGEHYRDTDYVQNEDDLVMLRNFVLRRPISGSERGPGVDRAYATCSAYAGGPHGVDATQHELQMVALLPDGTSISSNVVHVDLSCPSCVAEGGLGCDSTDLGSGSTNTDDTVADAGYPILDAGLTATAEPDASVIGRQDASTSSDTTPATSLAIDGTSTPSDTSVAASSQAGSATVDTVTTNVQGALPTHTNPQDASVSSTAPVDASIESRPDPGESTHDDTVIESRDSFGGVTTNPSATEPEAKDAGNDAGTKQPVVPRGERKSGCSTTTAAPPTQGAAFATLLLALTLGTRRSKRRLSTVHQER